MAGDWLILMLNSNIPAGRGSAQWEFARQQLEAQRTPCTMAVWHHPLFTSGPNGGNAIMRDMWSLLEASRAEVVLNGHDHLYERFARQLSNGTADPANGIRQFTAGTGGAELYDFVRAAPNSESRIMRYGVIRFTLRPAHRGMGVPRHRRFGQRLGPRYLPLSEAAFLTSDFSLFPSQVPPARATISG